MIYVLDTNVLSERTKPRANRAVADFLRRVPAENVRLSAMVLAEIAQGVENNPSPALKKFLNELLGLALAPFGEEEALEWGRMTSAALAKGVRLKFRDAIIAATAAAHGWTVATRNSKDFLPLGVSVFNPWTQRL